ncbi:iron ABC transporter ATP-binding protein [Candidatus Magnetomorum sp. HK-1]|nr:iron ABC transporter ATP-binding protein [Candidatus Magnetomorum sp. HK-1]
MMLQVNDLDFDYQRESVLKNISFQVYPKEIISIMGPNGVGKTTLLRCINAIIKPKSGVVMVQGQDISSLSHKEIAKKIGYVAQYSQSSRLTAFDAILLGRMPHMKWGVSAHDLSIVNAVIKQLNLQKLSLRYIDEMSGGERQKISIARAIVQEPDILLLDEPTSSLDLKNQIEILKLLQTVIAEHTVSAIITMHDINMALRYADRFVFIKQGKIYACSDRNSITKKLISDVYGVAVSINDYHGYPVVVPE